MDIKNEILEIILDRKNELKISNYKLHQLTNLSQSSISRYFKGETEMGIEAFLKIIKALDLNISLYPSEYTLDGFESNLKNSTDRKSYIKYVSDKMDDFTKKGKL